MNGLIRILFVEDFADDAILIARRLAQLGLKVEHDIVDTADALTAKLGEKRHDIILCDYNIPAMDAHRSLEIIGTIAPHIPVIVVSGSIGEEQAADLMRAGARDIVLKSNLGRLAPAIEREIAGRNEQARLVARADESERALDASERRYRQTFEDAPVAMCWISLDGRYLRTNRAFQTLSGFSAEELTHMGPADTAHPNTLTATRHRIADLVDGTLDRDEGESQFIRTLTGRGY